MPIFFQHDVDAFTRIGVWHIDEDEDFFLKDVPLQREITHPHKRLQHLAGRYLLRYLFPGFPTSLVRVADTRKPFLESEAYHFSISHCGDFAAVIASTRDRVGIDIEIPTEKVLRLTQKFLGEHEIHLLDAFPSYNHLQSATLLWSAKEAMFKWWGAGKVDFRKMMRLKIKGEKLEGLFFTQSRRIPLNLTFRFFDELVLVFSREDFSSSSKLVTSF